MDGLSLSNWKHFHVFTISMKADEGSLQNTTGHESHI